MSGESDDKVVSLFPSAPDGTLAEREGEQGDETRKAILQLVDNMRAQIEKKQIRSLVISFVDANGRAGQLMAVGFGGVPAQLGALRVAEARLLGAAVQTGEV